MENSKTDTLAMLKQQAIERNTPEDKIFLLAIADLENRPTITIKEVCEFCGQYSKGRKLHKKCKKYWL
jgi:hypothetical protein